jgi:hypothetical protein
MTWTIEKLEEHFRQQIGQWKRFGIKAKGKEELLGHFNGDDLTRQEAIAAHCYECMGGYGDGEDRDCQNPPCPLYPYHPYNPNKRIISRPGAGRNLLRANRDRE